MATATVAMVKEVMDTNLSDADITAHINIASDLVTTALVSSGLGSTRITNIERYVAAHLIAMRDRLAGQTSAEWLSSEAKVEFSGKWGEALKSTNYGQTAIVLDTTGTLSQMGAARAIFRAI